MTEKQLIKTVNTLLTFAMFCLGYGLLGIITKPHTEAVRMPAPKILRETPEEIPEQYEYPEYDLEIAYFENWYKPTHKVRETVTEVTTEYKYLGYYYLTAYCPWECGYNGYNYPAGWRTASGAICHRADYEHRITEPTTVAIDRTLHNFGTVFYIPEFDRTFVAEDTGSAVRGYHLDLFYEDYGEMASFPTGYYEVYAVEYIFTEKEVEYYDFEKVRGVQSIVYKHDHNN